MFHNKTNWRFEILRKSPMLLLISAMASCAPSPVFFVLTERVDPGLSWMGWSGGGGGGVK